MNPFLPFLAFLISLSIYIALLGLINRRQRPLLVSGPWDFAGVLFAVSGFLLVGGPSMLSWINERWQIEHLRSTDSPGYFFWLGLWILYFLAVVSGSILLLWSRRNQLAVYNIDPPVFDDALANALDRTGLVWSRSGQQMYLSYAGSPALHGAGLSTNPSRVKAPTATGEIRQKSLGSFPESMGPAARIELDPSPGMRHVTLYFNDVEEPLRQEIVSELARSLTQVWTRPHATGAWMFAVAALLFCVAVVGTLGVIVLSLISQV